MLVLPNHHAVVLGDGRIGGVGLDVVIPARPNDAAPVWVPLLAQLHHLRHLLGRDDGIARLPKKDAGIVAKVDHRIAHYFHALVPLPAKDVALLVSCGAHLDDAEAREGVRIDLLRRDVHPAHVVPVALADELRRVVVHPLRITRAHGGPLIGGALGKPLEVDEFFIEVDAACSRAALELRLAESGLDTVRIDHLPVHLQHRVDVVKIRIVRAPPARILECAGSGHHTLLTIDHIHRVAIKLRMDFAKMIDDGHRQCHCRAVAGAIVYLGIHGHVGCLLRNIKVSGVNVDALTLQPVVQRQRLVYLSGYMNPDRPVDAAVIGVEVVGIPLEAQRHAIGAVGVLRIRRAKRALLIARGVVHLHGEDVLLPRRRKRVSDVDAIRVDAILVQANLLAVEIDVPGLTHPLELDVDLAPRSLCGQLEVLAIPGEPLVRSHIAAAVDDDLAERVHIVEAVRCAHRRPTGVVKGRRFGSAHVLPNELPVEVEVQLLPRRRRRHIPRTRGKHRIP